MPTKSPKPKDRRPTAIVVDDHRDLLDMTAAMLELFGINVIARDQDGGAAVQHLREYRPDLAVMDILLPEPGGLDLLDVIRREDLRTRAIMMTGYHRREWVMRALDGGAFGYLIKPHSDVLGLAVKTVLSGERFWGPWACGVVSDECLRLLRDERTHGLLTPRESDVLRYRAEGKTVKEIAAVRQRSPKTIEKHVTSLKKKLNAETDADLFKYAVKIGLIRI